MSAPTNEGQVIAAEQHFHMANPTINKVLTLFLSQRITIVNSKTIFCSASETT